MSGVLEILSRAGKEFALTAHSFITPDDFPPRNKFKLHKKSLAKDKLGS